MQHESIHIQVSRVLQANRENSYSTQAARHDNLMLSMSDLYDLGYTNIKLDNLKPKHIKALVDDWKDSQVLETGTIKNRVSHLRWLVGKLNKQNIIPRTNKELGIDKRTYVDNTKNRAKELLQIDLNKISSERVRVSLRLQREFGLRKEESMKFQPDYAIRGDEIHLKASWCKGGRERVIGIRTDSQRALLDDCRRVAGQQGSMIPPEKTYKAHLSSFEKYVSRAGIRNMHGYRHMYAQERYRELTGFRCPKQGGLTSKNLTVKQKQIDREARLTISHELGHWREDVTSVYLGR